MNRYTKFLWFVSFLWFFWLEKRVQKKLSPFPALCYMLVYGRTLGSSRKEPATCRLTAMFLTSA